jgi:hypothetical protein
MGYMRDIKIGLLNWGIALLVALVFAAPAAAAVNGAIYTTISDGTTVNGNIYDSKAAVYLTGGPQNTNNPGLVPDGLYYFQVTNPSGSMLLSQDDVTCRQVQVTGGRIVGVPAGTPPAACAAGAYHAIGIPNSSNGNTPVQLIPYLDTDNPGGEYKAWLTPTGNYSLDGSNCSSKSNVTFGFCDADSKTDNFKIKQPGAAYVTVCKFEDLVGDGTQTSGPPIPGWPITATGVDAGGNKNQTVNTQTGDPDGCVSFSFTDFTNGVANEPVGFTEGTLGADWVQTYPANNAGYSLTLKPGDDKTVYFGNFNQNCIPVERCSQNGGLTSSKDANAGNKFTWTIDKAVNKTEIDTSSDATFTYTVTLTHDDGAGWKVAGTITLTNNSFTDITANVTDAIDNGGTCDVTDKQVTIGAGEQEKVPYSCTFAGNPGSGKNTVTVTGSTDFNGNPVSDPDPATADYAFTDSNIVGGTVTVEDGLDPGTPRTFKYTDTSPISYSYDHKFTGDPAGTCTNHKNTAAFTSGATGESSQTVKVCVGKDLTVSKTASPAYKRTYNWNITKAVDKTLIEQVGGSAVFNYTVVASETGFTDSDWTVTGKITVSNPNDWEDIVANVSDAIDNGGSCSVTGGANVTVPKSGSVTLDYACTYAAAPSPAAFKNTATATWTSSTYFTPSGSATGTATGAFGDPTTKVNQTIHVTDSYAGALGTLTATDSKPFASKTFTYSRTVTALPGACRKVDNTAAITETGQTASARAELCNTNTGALTMGFWKNTNGQAIIKNYCVPASNPSLVTFLRAYNPFSNLIASSTCSQVASYVSGTIGAASCTSSSGTCNSMLKAQMLATALDVYFSDPGLGGNKIGAYNGLGAGQPVLGNVNIDLTKICPKADGGFGGACGEDVTSVFGGKPPVCRTVSYMLNYQNTSDPLPDAGAVWYGQTKAKQVLAKDAFDAINNLAAGLCP